MIEQEVGQLGLPLPAAPAVPAGLGFHALEQVEQVMLLHLLDLWSTSSCMSLFYTTQLNGHEHFLVTWPQRMMYATGHFTVTQH